jgi:molybdopterin/thiamine biosynthesis adenylyltransferase/rhodanese-related sulfurtransferase
VEADEKQAREKQQTDEQPRLATPAAERNNNYAPPSASQPPAFVGRLSKDHVERYSRHLMLPEIAVTGQTRLLRARVLVVGAGGLGSTAILFLAAAGVGTIGIVDDDIVERSNLQRQVIHVEASVGVAKAVSAAERVRALSPGTEVDVHTVRLTARNAVALVSRYDVVVDAVDNPSARYLISDACVAARRPMVSGAAVRMEGTCSVFNAPPPSPSPSPSHSPSPSPSPSGRAAPTPTGCYRCLHPVPPPRSAVTSCGDDGVLGAVPGTIGCIQAIETVKLIAGGATGTKPCCSTCRNITAPSDQGREFPTTTQVAAAVDNDNTGNVCCCTDGQPGGPVWDRESSLVGRMLMFDAADARVRTVRLRGRSAACVACGDDPTINTVDAIAAFDYDSFCGVARGEVCATRLAGAGAQQPQQPQQSQQSQQQQQSQQLHPAHHDLAGAATDGEDASCVQRTATTDDPAEIEPAELAARLAEGSTLVIDVRAPRQFAMCALPGAVSIPLNQLAQRLDELRALAAATTAAIEPGLAARPTTIALLCRRGVDSRTALDTVRSSAPDLAHRTCHVRGGLVAWARTVDPRFPLY